MKNYRTTITGAILAVLVAIQPIIEAANGGKIDWGMLSVAAGLALFGFLAKDAGVSGTQK